MRAAMWTLIPVSRCPSARLPQCAVRLACRFQVKMTGDGTLATFDGVQDVAPLLIPELVAPARFRDEVRHPGLKEAFKTEGDRSAIANTNAVPTMVMSNCRARNCMLPSVTFHLATVVAGIRDPLDALALLAFKREPSPR